MSYEGIAADTLFLLAENRFNDSKAFYEEHKAQIKAQAIDPLRRLVAELAPMMQAIDPLIVTDPLKNGCVSRVRRDDRYTRDKSMYRENLWIAFQRDKVAWDRCVPAFFLDFSANYAEWGVGFYSARPEVMRELRSRIEADPAVAIAAVQAAEAAGCTISGQPYARVRSKPDTPAPLRLFYDCRSVSATCSQSAQLVADPALPEHLAQGFTALAPFYHLLTDAVERARGMRRV